MTSHPRNSVRRCRTAPVLPLALSILIGFCACTGPSWRAGNGMFVTSRQVATVLNDPLELKYMETFDPASVPFFDPPKRLRPCCAFGMDLKAKVGLAIVPGYEIGNIISLEELGPHGYDNGTVSFSTDRSGRMVRENNGLLYTCRGGFIDTSHIRDYADRMLYLTMQIARALPAAITVVMPDEGTQLRVVVQPVSKSLLERLGRWRTATLLAQWATYKLSIWHEIITWYGFETIKGFSEKESAFSPEDLYSNLLGIKLAGGVILHKGALSRDSYDQSMDAWIRVALKRLGVVSRQDGRIAMNALDGLWWDSKRAVPEYQLVLHRNLDISPPLSPWVLPDELIQSKVDPRLINLCRRHLLPLSLELPERLGDLKITDIVSIDFEFTDWIPDPFPIPISRGKVIGVADFPTIIESLRREAAAEFGAGFDRPWNTVSAKNPPSCDKFSNVDAKVGCAKTLSASR